jgi:hypothetical protein
VTFVEVCRSVIRRYASVSHEQIVEQVVFTPFCDLDIPGFEEWIARSSIVGLSGVHRPTRSVVCVACAEPSKFCNFIPPPTTSPGHHHTVQHALISGIAELFNSQDPLVIRNITAMSRRQQSWL